MRTKLVTLLAAAVLLIPAVSIAQIGQTAVLTGTVSDASGAVLPGVTVTVTGESVIGGTRDAVTDENGIYRFPSLPPGTYAVSAQLSGFKPFTQQDVRLQLGQTITVDPRLEVGGFEDRITVAGGAPVVDVKASAAQKNITEEMMENIPFTSRFGPGAMLAAPGVNPNNYSSYGSGEASSNAYLVDGVDVSDPEGGTIWLFSSHNWIQEVQVIGLGANAEYGGFTGVASNSLFRSGSNIFKGLFETLYENDAMTGRNVSDELLEGNPQLTPGSTEYLTDTTIQIGGPIRQDKVWFFTSFQYYRPKTTPAGFPPPTPPSYTPTGIGPQARLESSPRFLFKPTIKIGESDQLTGFFETDSYTVDARNAEVNVFGDFYAPEATLHQDSPEVAWNANFTKVLSSSSVFDIKYSGFWGYYYLSPYNGDIPGWYDVDELYYSQNSYYYYNADRVRHQANASLTKYASGFAGQHNLKFGAEFERSYVKSELGYSGGMYVFASYAVPYYAYLWDGYLKDNINTRFSAFAQDSWSVGPRVTINPGLRIDRVTGFNKHLDEQVFSTTTFAPRIGVAWDIAGNSKTVIRGHYGWFFDGAKSTFYDLLDPEISDFYGADIDENLNVINGPFVIEPGRNRTLDENIKHPRLRQTMVGVEHELLRGLSVGVTGIWRKNDRFIDDVIQTPLSEYAATTLQDPGPDALPGTGDETSNTYVQYDQLTDPNDNQFLITNPEGAFRDYRGIEFTATKRMSNRWQLQGSWVISKIEGNYNNTNNYGNSNEYDEPNLDPRRQPFREGRLTNDNTHLAKVIGTYRAPWDLLTSAAFLYTSGQTFTRTVRPTLTQGRPDIFVEPRGSQRYDGQPRFDFKVEKQFRLTGDKRIGVTFEGFNVFNNAAINARGTRSGSSYFEPRGLVLPRRFRVGGVYRF